MNVWHSCVDVAVEENIFPVSLLQSSDYYQVCPSSQEHWRRFGSITISYAYPYEHLNHLLINMLN